MGIEQAGVEIDWHGFSDIDKYANKVFKRRFPNAKELGSVVDVNPRELPKIDLVTFGFPCQDLSQAGKRKGLKGSRSGLFFEAMRIIEAKKPTHFIFENVEGIFSSNEGKDFEIILRTISDCGYDGQWQLLNTRWFLPQNRSRCYFVGHLRGECRPKIFPIEENDRENRSSRKGEVKISCAPSREYGWKDISPTLCARDHKDPKLVQVAKVANGDAGRVFDPNGIACTLKAEGGGWGAKTGLYRVDDVNLIAKKRAFDTPKEINLYLKKHKVGTIKEIAEKLDLPKTQVEHYFRADNSRAIPDPKIWLRLKELLGLDDTYDKEVTEIYEKEYEFESSKRVYDAKGIAQTLSTGNTGLYKVEYGQKSLNETLEQNDLKEDDIKALDLYNRKAQDISPTLTEPHHNTLRLFEKSNIRRLTPTECERLQGFPDGWTEGQSDTQRYRQMGNAVSVPVVRAVVERLYGLRA